MKRFPKKFFLVYQAGIANVFAVDCFNLSSFGRNAKRVLQHAYSPCVNFVRGAAAAGAVVRTAACNQAGDIIDSTWSEDLNAQPFADKLVDVCLN